ncbi:hypothetical protein, partial [Rhodovulum sulfidophilum]|uniref:hypothetical protein n=1 Tax=Rhodovulum sulfidophilum TaxID=35806 RepID=UPI001F274923
MAGGRGLRHGIDLTHGMRAVNPPYRFVQQAQFEVRDALNRVAERFSQYGFVNTGSIFALCWYELTQGPHFEHKLKASTLKDLEQKQVAEDLRILKLQSALGH